MTHLWKAESKHRSRADKDLLTSLNVNAVHLQQDDKNAVNPELKVSRKFFGAVVGMDIFPHVSVTMCIEGKVMVMKYGIICLCYVCSGNADLAR